MLVQEREEREEQREEREKRERERERERWETGHKTTQFFLPFTYVRDDPQGTADIEVWAQSWSASEGCFTRDVVSALQS